MDANQNLYYALGILAYAIAKSDGTIQSEEKKALHDIVLENLDHTINFYYSEIIFELLVKDKRELKEVYDWAMKEFELGKYHLTKELQEQFSQVIEKIAEAFPPNTKEEKKLIDQFESDIKGLVYD